MGSGGQERVFGVRTVLCEKRTDEPERNLKKV